MAAGQAATTQSLVRSAQADMSMNSEALLLDEVELLLSSSSPGGGPGTLHDVGPQIAIGQLPPRYDAPHGVGMAVRLGDGSLYDVQAGSGPLFGLFGPVSGNVLFALIFLLLAGL